MLGEVGGEGLGLEHEISRLDPIGNGAAQERKPGAAQGEGSLGKALGLEIGEGQTHDAWPGQLDAQGVHRGRVARCRHPKPRAAERAGRPARGSEHRSGAGQTAARSRRVSSRRVDASSTRRRTSSKARGRASSSRS